MTAITTQGVICLLCLWSAGRPRPAGRARRPPLHCMIHPQPRALVPCRLKTFHQIADAQRVGFAMTVTGDGVGASGGFNKDVRPNHSRRNLHRRYLGSRNAFLTATKPTPLHTAHTQRADHDARGEKQVSPGPAARAEGLFGSSGIGNGRIWPRGSYTHSSAPFFQIHMYPTIRMPRKTSISISPKTPSALNFTAQGNRKMVSTSNTTNRMAMM